MGKALLIIVFGIFVAGGVMYSQSHDTNIASVNRQADYQKELLAREIARSAYGIAQLKLQKADTYQQALASINGWGASGAVNSNGKTTGAYQGGSYEITAQPVDGQIIKVNTTGIYEDARETITSYYRVEMLVVSAPSTMTVEFLASEAGWCSAVFLQQYTPISPGDSLGSLFGTISADGKWFEKFPEMLFPSGNYRNGTTTTPAHIVLQTGTRLNFFIGVDQDCSSRDLWIPLYDPLLYDDTRYALQKESNVHSMVEGPYAIIERFESTAQQWRIAFEDAPFTDAQLQDVKLSGYGGSWDNENQTYGGTGWIFTNGYRNLSNQYHKPGFWDQVIEVTLNPVASPL